MSDTPNTPHRIEAPGNEEALLRREAEVAQALAAFIRECEGKGMTTLQIIEAFSEHRASTRIRNVMTLGIDAWAADTALEVVAFQNVLNALREEQRRHKEAKTHEG